MPIKKIGKGARKFKSSRKRKKPLRKRLNVALGKARIKVSNVSFKKIYGKKKPKTETQFNFEGLGQGRRGFKFDASATFPRKSFDNIGQHIKRNRFKYELLGHGAVGYGVHQIANRNNRYNKEQRRI